MKKLLLPMVAALGLAACSTTQQAQGVDALKASLIMDETVATQYAKGELSITPDPAIVAKIKNYDNAATDQVNNLEVTTKAGKKITTSLQSAAQLAITDFTNYLIDNKIATQTTTVTSVKLGSK